MADNDNMLYEEEVTEVLFIDCAFALLRHRGATDARAMDLVDLVFGVLGELESNG